MREEGAGVGRAEVESEAAGREAALEWEMLAAVLDRLFLILFQLCIFVVTAAFVSLGFITEQSQYVRDRDNII